MTNSSKYRVEDGVDLIKVLSEAGLDKERFANDIKTIIEKDLEYKDHYVRMISEKLMDIIVTFKDDKIKEKNKELILVKCKYCNGDGYTIESRKCDPNECLLIVDGETHTVVDVKCPKCNGTGKVPK